MNLRQGKGERRADPKLRGIECGVDCYDTWLEVPMFVRLSGAAAPQKRQKFTTTRRAAQ